MTATAEDACVRCDTALEMLGVEEFRVGGTTGGWKMIFGAWAELGEGMLSFEILVCPNCRRVELRSPS